MKVMRCSGLFFCAFALIVILSLCMGCTSGTGGENLTKPSSTPVAELKVVTFSADNTTPESYTIEDAVTAMATDNQTYTDTQNLTICYIKGTNVDHSGKAEHWLLGLCGGTKLSMVVYDSYGVSRMNASPWMPDQKIDINAIISPEKIIGSAYPDRQDVILPQLEIKDGEYILTTPQGEKPRQFVFNATTGVPIAAND